MDKEVVANIVVQLENEIGRLMALVKALKSETRPERFQCQCDVEYTGTHTFPCKGRK